jgi:CHAT domain-containing protein
MPKLKVGELEQNFKLLPGSEREANAVAQFFNVEALTGSKANKATVVEKMKTARVIHLATHGILDDFKSFGIKGAIVLAPDGNRDDTIDGLLTAGEIFEMKLRADLVVLSACDTGNGVVTSDGVVGLSRYETFC